MSPSSRGFSLMGERLGHSLWLRVEDLVKKERVYNYIGNAALAPPSNKFLRSGITGPALSAGSLERLRRSV